MNRTAVLLLGLVALAGCKNQMSSQNWLAPLGSSRVPPPGTNAHQGTAPYYNGTAPAATLPAGGTATPGAVVPASGATASPTLPHGSAMSPTSAAANPLAGNWQPVGTGVSASIATPASSAIDAAVQPASFSAPVDAASSGASGSTLRLKGMPVHDATGQAAPGEPAAFQPAAGAAPLVPLSTGAAAASSPDGMATAVSKASDNFDAVVDRLTSGGTSTLNWKTRFAAASGTTAPGSPPATAAP